MHPLTLCHDWIIGHPIAFTLILFALALPFSIYSSEIKAFLKLPPQKLGTWILSARVIATESRIDRLSRFKDEPSYAIAQLVRTVTYSLGLILLYVFSIYVVVGNPKESRFIQRTQPVTLTLTFLVWFMQLRHVRDVVQATEVYSSTREMLEAKLARLTNRLPQGKR